MTETLVEEFAGSIARALGAALSLDADRSRLIARTVAASFVGAEPLEMAMLRATATAESLGLGEEETLEVQRVVTGCLASVDALPSLAARGVSEATVVGRYRVIETLSPGLEDALYLAHRLETGDLVELRVVSGDPRASDELERALRGHAARVAGAASQCPGIATMHGCERAGRAVVVAMAHPEGVTLRELLQREVRVRTGLALGVAIQIARALERAHHIGLVHGGLRPENIVLAGPRMTVSLTQFGLDRLLASRRDAGNDAGNDIGSGEGGDGCSAGTTAGAEEALYEAPEQSSGNTSERSDIYSLCAIVYEMLAGVPANGGRAAGRLAGPEPLRAHCPDLSPRLEGVLMRGLQPAPQRRPASISALGDDLWAELGPGEQPSLVPGRTVATRRGVSRRAKQFAAVSGVLAAAAFSIWFAHSRMPSTTSAASNLPPLSAPVLEETHPPGPAVLDRAASPSPEAGTTSGPSGAPLPPPVRAVAPPLSAESIPAARTANRDEVARRPARRDEAGSVTRLQPRPPASEGGEDPAAIIDWLLSRGEPERR